MTPRKRIMTALASEEPDCVPFADWIEDRVKQNLLKAIFFKPENVFAMAEAKDKYGSYPIKPE